MCREIEKYETLLRKCLHFVNGFFPTEKVHLLLHNTGSIKSRNSLCSYSQVEKVNLIVKMKLLILSDVCNLFIYLHLLLPLNVC